MQWVSTGSPIISAQSTISLLVVEDDGTGFIGVTDKCEKAVCLSAAYRCIADLINDDKLCFLDIFEVGIRLHALFLRCRES